MIRCPHCQHEFDPPPALALEDDDTTKKGTRLPDDFVVPQKWLAWARVNRAGVNANVQARLFVNYWTAKTGASATKRSWFRTWQVWIMQCRVDPRDVPPPRPATNLPQNPPQNGRAPAQHRVELTDEQRAANRARFAELASGAFAGKVNS